MHGRCGCCPSSVKVMPQHREEECVHLFHMNTHIERGGETQRLIGIGKKTSELEDRPLEAEGAVNMEVKLRLLKNPVPKGLGCQDHCCRLVSVATINTTIESNLGGRGLFGLCIPITGSH